LEQVSRGQVSRSKGTGRKFAEAALVANTAVWGATFVLVKGALADISPLLFLAFRFSLATVALLLFFHRALARQRFRFPEIRAGALVGAFLFAGFALQTFGLRLTTAPKSAFLTGATSVMVPLLARLVYRSRPQRSEILGVLVATVGMGLMTLESPVAFRGINRGDLLTLGCAVAFAAQIVTQGHFSERISFELLSVVQVAAAGLLAGSLFWWAEPPRLIWHAAVVWAVVVTGLLATAVAFTVQAWAQQFTTATRTALIYMLEPVFAWLTSFLLVGEGLSTRAAVGAALILGGIVLVEAKPLEPRLHPLN
jgi:drug/metabolite transporter (DMT)-like permease